ncbi:hypothetical protein C8Q76DRAFT_119930 [Earliella scabrosa]|nr:hypothetical protein C8Q76DRAFT_119930 [Earliella scabrosa]
MASQYSIDGSNTTTFTPLSTVSQPGYRQLFFLSQFFSPEKHTLTITNLGENFYLDYILLHVVPSVPGMTFIPGPIPLSPVQDSSPTPDQSTSREDSSTRSTFPPSIPPSTPPPQETPTETQQSRTSSTSLSLISLDHSSFLSETRVESRPWETSASSSSMLPVSSTSSVDSATTPVVAAGQRSGGLTTGAYIAVAVGGAAVLLCLLVGAWLWYRQRQGQTQRQKNITPFGTSVVQWEYL